MVFKASDVKHLEIMRSLEDAQKQIKKDAAKEISFDEKILKLCDMLRSEGFGKYADNIEDKFVFYKAAAKTHLYRAHNEDGEDVIEFAHPDDGVKVGDAADDHGTINNVVVKHKKIVDIINKQPTGKLASYVNQCKVALGQDDTARSKLVSELAGLVSELTDVVNSSIYQSIGPKTKYYESKLPNGKKVSYYFKDAKYDINGIKNLYSQVLSSETNMALKSAIKETNMYIYNIFGSDDSLLNQINKSINGGIKVFDNTDAIDLAISSIKPLVIKFHSIYNRFEGRDTTWQDKFFTNMELKNILDRPYTQMIALVAKIDRYILSAGADDAIKNNKGLIEYFGKVKTAALNNGEIFFTRVLPLVIDFRKNHQAAGREDQGLIDTNVLKNIFNSINAGLTNDLNFFDKNSFIKSLDDLNKKFLALCYDELNDANIPDVQYKSELLKNFAG